MKVSPSILAADFLNLGEAVDMLNVSADFIHLDIMDGEFVPNISYGFPVVEAVARRAAVGLDAHLMTVHPDRWFGILAELGVGMISFHQEAAGRKTSSYIAAIHALGARAGVAIDPDVPISRLFPYIGKADFFLIMSVFAGFGGQKFIYDSLDRVEALRNEIGKRGFDSDIEVDGGVDLSNAAALKEAGATVLVAGSSVFRSPDPAAAVLALKKV